MSGGKRDWWQRLKGWWRGPMCSVHPDESLGGPFGCYACFGESMDRGAKEVAQRKREQRIEDMTEALRRLLPRERNDLEAALARTKARR